jgi:hypothetical protein
MTTQRSDKDSPEIRALDGQIMQAEAQNRWPQAAQLLRSRAQRVAPVAEQARTLEHLVSVYRVKLSDERSAMQVAEELLTVDASHSAARQYLVDGYTRQGNSAKVQQLQASAPSGGGFLGAITGALGSAATAVGAAATGFAGAVEQSNKNPEWMRAQGQSPAVPQSAPQAARPAPPADPRCPYCGADLARGAKNCGQCGAEL